MERSCDATFQVTGQLRSKCPINFKFVAALLQAGACRTSKAFSGDAVMAIGWGKSYEEQMEEASQRASAERIPRVPMEERARLQRTESLKLSRSRIEDQLSKAVRPAHRQMLMKALQAIEVEAEEIAQAPSEEESESRP
jgi:hypothetical protein